MMSSISVKAVTVIVTSTTSFFFWCQAFCFVPECHGLSPLAWQDSAVSFVYETRKSFQFFISTAKRRLDEIRLIQTKNELRCSII